MSAERNATIETLELFAAGAGAAGAVAPGPAGPAMSTASVLLRTIAIAMRLQGKTVEEILQAIEMPRPVDVSDFRRDIDTAIKRKPSRDDG